MPRLVNEWRALHHLVNDRLQAVAIGDGLRGDAIQRGRIGGREAAAQRVRKQMAGKGASEAVFLGEDASLNSTTLANLCLRKSMPEASTARPFS